MDSGNCYPFMCNDSGTSSGLSIDYQEVYALSTPGTITSLGFQYWTPGGGNDVVLGGDYNVYLSYSANPVGSLSSDLASNVLGPQTLFYSGNLGGSTGDFTIDGTTSFTYNPADGPLLMEVVVDDQDNVPNYSGNGYNWADYTGVQVARAYNIPDTGNNLGNVTGALVTTFTYNATVPEPSTLAFLGSGLLLLAGVARRRFNRRG
jgi:hypothetical protein